MSYARLIGVVLFVKITLVYGQLIFESDFEGRDNCDYVPDPSLSVGETGDLIGITDAHNAWRVRVGVTELVWSTDIADNAQAYANTCPQRHSSWASLSNVGTFSQLGENIHLHPNGTADPVLAVDSWARERAYYDFGDTITSDNTFFLVGHYTQVVWGDTTHVGCGVIRGCPRWGTIVVCQYGETGNYVGQAPYGFSRGSCLDLDNDDIYQANDPDDTNRAIP